MGPLDGLVVIEMDAVGPVPFAAMLLGDLGAEVTWLARPGGAADPLRSVTRRNRRSIAIDLKHPEGRDVAIDLIAAADVVLEGFRPGVMERLGLGPEPCLGRNPALVYGRMTGWGQTGPMAGMAGHDIDYLALTGALHAIGEAASPVPPLNLAADFGGGALYLLLGVMAALFERVSSGRGQVVDAAMVDGAASLMTMTYQLAALGMWSDRRRANLLDGGAPFYRTYRTSDGRFVAVGAIEPQFYAALMDGLGLAGEALPHQLDRDGWPEIERRISEVIAGRTRDEWAAAFDGTDACVAPVMALGEAPHHPHMADRRTFVETAGVIEPAPAPRFSRSSVEAPRAPIRHGADTDAVLSGIGYGPHRITALRDAGVVE